jgi:hypothetical protein
MVFNWCSKQSVRKKQNENTIDTNNPSKVLSLLQGKFDTVIDFTAGEHSVNPASVALGDFWTGVVPEDINTLNDLRETKGYAVYMKESDVAYSGFQNTASSTGNDYEADYLVNITHTQDDQVTVRDGIGFSLDIQPTEVDVVIDTLVLKVSTPGATTTEVIEDALRGDLLQNNGESALYEFYYDQRTAITAGQKRQFTPTFIFNKDFVDKTNTQQIQISVGSEETELWKLYTASQLIPTNQIGGNISSTVYTIFSYGAIVEDLDVSARGTYTPGTLQFEVELDAEFVGGPFNVIDDMQTYSTTTSSATINGLAYRIEGPEGFESTTTIRFDKSERDSQVNMEYEFMFSPSLSGVYTLVVEDIFFVSDDRDIIKSVFEEDIEEDESQRRARVAVQNPADNLTGFAALEEFDLFSAEHTSIPVGARDRKLAVGEASFSDGDALIQSLQIQLPTVPDGVNMWEVFESFSLWVDGDKVDEVQIHSMSDLLGASHDIVQFDNLELISLQNEITELIFAADISPTTSELGLGTYELQVYRFVYQDAGSVATTETEFDDIGQFGGVNFEIDSLIQELEFSLSSQNPDSTILVVDEDNDSDEITIFAYDVSSDDSNTDITIGGLAVTVSSSTYSNIVDDATLIIDGIHYDDIVVTDGDTNTASLYFDINDNHEVGIGATAEVELTLEFNALEPELEGVTVMAEVNQSNVAATDAVGLDDLTLEDFAGAAYGETHTLLTEGILVPADVVTTETATVGDNDQVGVFSIEFEVTSFENDFYIPDTGVNFRVDGGTATTASSFSSTADENTPGVYVVREGVTETFALEVTVDPSSTDVYRLVLESIKFSDMTDGVTNMKTKYLFPESDYRTNAQVINGGV